MILSGIGSLRLEIHPSHCDMAFDVDALNCEDSLKNWETQTHNIKSREYVKGIFSSRPLIHKSVRIDTASLQS